LAALRLKSPKGEERGAAGIIIILLLLLTTIAATAAIVVVVVAAMSLSFCCFCNGSVVVAVAVVLHRCYCRCHASHPLSTSFLTFIKSAKAACVTGSQKATDGAFGNASSGLCYGKN
jgi:hypothetical protein